MGSLPETEASKKPPTGNEDQKATAEQPRLVIKKGDALSEDELTLASGGVQLSDPPDSPMPTCKHCTSREPSRSSKIGS
jgi:hypothetical protein